MANETNLVIDSDAHVIENEHTWDFLEPSEAKYRPRVVNDPDNTGFQYWENNTESCVWMCVSKYRATQE